MSAGKQPPNIMIMIDSSLSMSDCPAASPCADTKIEIAEDVLVDMLETINPLDISTAAPNDRLENARFGLFTFRSPEEAA